MPKFANLNPREIFANSQIAKLNPCEIFRNSKFAKLVVVAGIKNAVAKGMSGLPSLYPFNDIDPMLVEESNLPAVNSSGLSMASKYVSDYGIEEESDEEEWVEENEDDENRNFFDVFDDEDNDL